MRRARTGNHDRPNICEGEEEWVNITDPQERKRVQNRVAQRNYRKRLKKHIEELECDRAQAQKVTRAESRSQSGPRDIVQQQDSSTSQSLSYEDESQGFASMQFPTIPPYGVSTTSNADVSSQQPLSAGDPQIRPLLQSRSWFTTFEEESGIAGICAQASGEYGTMSDANATTKPTLGYLPTHTMQQNDSAHPPNRQHSMDLDEVQRSESWDDLIRPIRTAHATSGMDHDKSSDGRVSTSPKLLRSGQNGRGARRSRQNSSSITDLLRMEQMPSSVENQASLRPSSKTALEEQFTNILLYMKEAGFENFESMVFQYYTSNFRYDSVAHWAQKHSRLNRMKPLIIGLQSSSLDWSEEEAKQFQDGILKVASQVCSSDSDGDLDGSVT